MTRLNATMALVVALCALLASCAQPSSLTSGTTSTTTLSLSSISPSEADAGGGALTLTAAGGSFGSTSVVVWNGSSRATTVVNPTTLSASISSADLANVGDVTVAVRDAKTSATTNSLHFTIHPKRKNPTPLSVTTTLLSGATAGTAYQASLAATGGATPYMWSVASGQLPSGLSLSSGGVITGTPAAAGAFSFTMQVKDSASSPQTATKTLAINVVAAAQSPAPISISTTTLAGATAGTAYNAALTAMGGTAPYTWSVVSGALPAGLSLSSSGAISGTPTTGGTVGYFTVSAKDSASSPQAATQALSISVASAAGIAPPPQATGYSLKFSDDFNSLNMSPNGNGAGYNWYNPGIFWNSPAPYSNITDASSILHLNWTPSQGTNDTSLATASQNGANYRAWRYGYFEVRMRWNPVTGAWPAIWLIPTAGYSGANEQGELDIFEGQGAYPHTYYGTIHHWLNKSSVGSNSNSTQNLGSNVDFSQWHTYGCLWTPGQVTWYFDNQPLMSASTYSIFDQQDYYLIIGSQEGANWSYGNMSGVTASSIWMDVDWVRVWQK